MKKLMIVSLMSLCIAVIGNAQDTATNSAPLSSFNAGGTPIAIPPPTTEMTEVGYDNRERLEVFVPSANRLIAGFMLTTEIDRLTKGDPLMSKYAMVEVPRRLEYMDCGPNEFKEVKSGVKAGSGDKMINSTMKKAEKELNRRIASLDINDAMLSFGKLIQLGSLFSKQDSYGFGMVMPVAMGGQKKKMVVSAIAMRIKQRLLFLYLCAEYKNEETIKWIRKVSEDWADAILNANK